MARDIESRAAQWLLRREEADWSSDDQALFDAWLDESMAHKASYWRLEHGWREADRIGALGSEHAPGLDSAVRRIRFGVAANARWANARWMPLALAASLVAMVGIGSAPYWRPSWQPSPTAVAQVRFDTPVGGRRIVPLADGSEIELNTTTVLRTAVTHASRDVWLDKGEAYFEVAHDERRPFVVHAGSRTVTVLGTKFSVRRESDKVTVSVVAGRVRVDEAKASGRGGSSIIIAGDTAIARGPTMLLAMRSDERVENALAWRTGMLNFDRTRLVDAVAEFNRYNRKPITITDAQAADIRIGGTFRASNVDAFVRLLRDAYGLRVESDAESVKISS